MKRLALALMLLPATALAQSAADIQMFAAAPAVQRWAHAMDACMAKMHGIPQSAAFTRCHDWVEATLYHDPVPAPQPAQAHSNLGCQWMDIGNPAMEYQVLQERGCFN